MLRERHRGLAVVHPVRVQRAGARMPDLQIALHDLGGAPDLAAAHTAQRTAEPFVQRRLHETGVIERHGPARRGQDGHPLSALPRRDEDLDRVLDRVGRHVRH